MASALIGPPSESQCAGGRRGVSFQPAWDRKTHARRADGSRQVERSVVGADKQRCLPAQGCQLPQKRRLRRHDRTRIRLGDDGVAAARSPCRPKRQASASPNAGKMPREPPHSGSICHSFDGPARADVDQCKRPALPEPVESLPAGLPIASVREDRNELRAPQSPAAAEAPDWRR